MSSSRPAGRSPAGALRGALREAARGGLRAAALTADLVTPRQPGVVVLAYHQVGGPRPSSVNLSPTLFAEHVAHLAGRHRVVTLDEAADLLAAGIGPDRSAPAGEPVVITFDDGTADFVDVALPILVDHGLPVTLYLETAHVEQGRSFWDDGTTLSWAAVAEAAATGLVTVGSHTHGHVLLDRITPVEAADSLDRSIELIAEHTGRPPTHLAFPKAVAPSPEVAAVVAARFRTAAGAGGGRNQYGATDPHRLRRVPVLATDEPAWFAHRARGRLQLEDRARDALDRRRYRGATG